MRLDVGEVLGGRYQLRNQIAVGGMGEVWAAHDSQLTRDVAIKVLKEQYAGDEAFLARLRNEARNSAKLSHPNIAQLYDYREEDGRGYLVMELVTGQPLSDLLDRMGVLTSERLLPILAQTARALHAAHIAGVIHRDVKPGNILLSRAGRVKITDFGISTAGGQSSHTAPGMVMGTAQYLSPEQATGRPASPASDIYALGIIAYEALVGNRPFTGPTAVDIAVAHVNEPVPPLPASVDPRLAAIVMRMLSKDPAQRQRTAADVAHQFDALVTATPPTGVPTPAHTASTGSGGLSRRSDEVPVAPGGSARRSDEVPVAAVAPVAASAPVSAASAAATATAAPAAPRPSTDVPAAPHPAAASSSARPVVVGAPPPVAPPQFAPAARHARQLVEAPAPSPARLIATSRLVSAAGKARMRQIARQRTARMFMVLVTVAVVSLLIGIFLGSRVFAAGHHYSPLPAAAGDLYYGSDEWTVPGWNARIV